MDIRTLNIPPEVKREVEEFAAEVERLHRGEVGEEEFKRFRLQQGIYGQRQENEQMVRTKLPLGRMTSDQLDALADFGENYSHGILHVTTRQDIQLHYVKLDDVPQGLQDLAEAGITTREACGNTVRNVTACHKAGTCAEEAFDVTPYGNAVSNYLLRLSLTQNLPRKFKISLGGCNGCGLAPIHDIGLKAAFQTVNGAEVRGFKVFAGGGLGASPHLAHLIREFVPADELLRVCEALVQVFDKYGDKRNRNKARFKFVFDKLGVEEVMRLIDEEYANLQGKSYPDIQVEEETIPEIPAFEPRSEFDSDPEFLAWKNRNTAPQRQDGFFNVQIKLILGDLTVAQARAISDIARRYAGSLILNTVNQNMMVPWVQEKGFGPIYGALKEIGLHKAGTEEIRDVTCCPGSETCNLGITHSRGLATVLGEQMENGFQHSDELDHISIKASGCPNSCGQHHIASIGFHGGAKKVNGILTPHYEIFMGGRVSEEEAVFGIPVLKVPAKNSPEVVKRSIAAYKKDKNENESFGRFFDRVGRGYFKELLRDLTALPGIEESPESYLDYNSKKKFSLEDRGQGECAGAVTDMIQDQLSEADRAIFQGKLALEKQAYAESIDHSKRSLVASSRALLVTEGMDFTEDLEVLTKFQSLVVDMEIVPERFAQLIDTYQEPDAPVDRKTAEFWIQETSDLAEDCKHVYNKMQTDHSLRIRVDGETKEPQKKGKTSPADAAPQKIDLLGVKCPFNYVKTKIKLETMASGGVLEVLLDPGEPAENVPRSIQNDGHKMLSLNEENGHYKLVIEKA